MRSTSTIHRIAALVAVSTLIAACGGGGGGGGGGDGGATDTTAAAGVEVTVRTTEFSYEPQDIEVPADTPLTLVLINDGVVEHDFTIEEAGVLILAQPGETVRETITLPAGTYHVHCSVPGHKDAGMVGSLTAG